MAYQGETLSVRALLERSLSRPAPTPRSSVGLRQIAADNALRCRDLFNLNDTVQNGWRYGILQTLDDYESTLRRGGTQLAQQVFTREPPLTGFPELDASFAALADHLANRDGWAPPDWVNHPYRSVERWYADVPEIFHHIADLESPVAFRSRGILITLDSLSRA